MRIQTSLAFAVALLALPPVHAAENPPEEALRKFVEESRKASGQLIQQIGGEMRKEVEANGPMRGVIVCKYTAPEVASLISRRNGMRVSRVSLKPRNPALGFADPWEQKVLTDFDARVARGEKAAELEYWEVVKEPGGTYLRYMKSIPTQKICLNCHGPVDQITDAVKAQLANEYPHDLATGYREGTVRGAVTVKKFWQ